jgi:SAM-dependent methyltransferase
VKLTKLRARWWREQYEPTWIGLVINPFYFARRGLLDQLSIHFSSLTGDLLDVGCGCKPYRALVPAIRYVGLDIDNPFTRKVNMADVFYDGTRFPLGDASFDSVLCSQVLEHVFKPEDFLQEINRVMRPGGKLLLAVPFMWDEHEQPNDFGRYSSFGLRALLLRCGFEIIEQGKSVADIGAVVQLSSGWLFKAVQTRNKWVNLMTQVALIMPLNILGAMMRPIFPRNEDFYLDNVVLARKPLAPSAGS